MHRKLLLITSEFPFGKGETFIENELPILAKNFDQVQILSLAESPVQSRDVPEKVSVNRSPVTLNLLQKIYSFRHIIQPEVRKELKRVKRVYGISRSKAVIATILFSWERARNIAKQIEPHIAKNVICYAYWSDDSAIALAMLKRQYPKNKVVARCHRWDIYFEESAIGYLPFRNYIANKLDALFSISEDGLLYIKSHWKIERTDVLQLSRLGTEPMEFSKRSMTNLLVSCSNVIPVKRVHFIARALGGLKESTFHWVHFGDGVQMSSLKELVEELGISDRVTFKGRCPNQEVLMFLKNNPVKLFINVSASEGIPVSIMEAMSVGIPVLATDVGGTGELVNDENGWLVAKDISQLELSAVIEGILKEDHLNMEKKSKAAYKTWESKFNAEKNYRLFVEGLLGLG
jgi:colanic acid/amylovoran biosynthesis glycosyltransferase